MISITPIQLHHAPFMQHLADDPAVAEMTRIPHPYPENGAIDFITKMIECRANKSDYVFAIEAGGSFTGACGLHNYDRISQSFVLGYWIGKPFWGKGIATQAVSLIVKFAFTELKLNMLYAICLERNAPSRRVLEKNNFREISRTPNSDLKWRPDDIIVRYELWNNH